MRFIPIVGGARINLERHMQRHCGVGSALHRAFNDRDRTFNFGYGDLENQFVMDL